MSRSVDMNKSPTTFSFLDIPLELRNIVYCELLESGHLGILQTSRGVNEEASKFLFSKAFLRCLMQGSRLAAGLSPVLPDQGTLIMIQNIEIRVDLESLYRFCTLRHLGPIINLRSWRKPYKTCRVTLLGCNVYRSFIEPHAAFCALRCLTSFQTVVLIAAFQDASHLYCELDSYLIRKTYNMAVEILAPVFGPVGWQGSKGINGEWLEFRPSQHQKTLSEM